MRLLRRPMVCLDIALERMCAIEVAGDEVTRWMCERLDARSMQGGDPADPPALAASLRNALDASGITGRRARISISDESVVTRIIKLPHMPRRHLPAAMRFAAERELPFLLDRAYYDWDVIGEDRTGTTILLVASWRDIVDRMVEVVTLAGLSPESVEPRSLAVARVLNLKRAVLLDAEGLNLYMTLYLDSQAPYFEQAPIGADGGDWRTALEILLDRAIRHQNRDSRPGGPAPVLVAGELEQAALKLPVQATAASSALNGHGPMRPVGLPSGRLLAPLGLATL